MLHCWSFEGFQTPSPVSCGPSAILHEPWATAKEVNWGVMNKVPNQNADPTVTALINLGGFNDLLATQQLAESGYKDPCNIQIMDAPPQTLLKEVPINFNDLDPNWNSSRYWFQHVYIKIYKRNLTKRYKQQRFASNIPKQIWSTGLYQIIFIPSSTSSTWHLDHPFRPQKHPGKRNLLQGCGDPPVPGSCQGINMDAYHGHAWAVEKKPGNPAIGLTVYAKLHHVARVLVFIGTRHEASIMRSQAGGEHASAPWPPGLHQVVVALP